MAKKSNITEVNLNLDDFRIAKVEDFRSDKGTLMIGKEFYAKANKNERKLWGVFQTIPEMDRLSFKSQIEQGLIFLPTK